MDLMLTNVLVPALERIFRGSQGNPESGLMCHLAVMLPRAEATSFLDPQQRSESLCPKGSYLSLEDFTAERNKEKRKPVFQHVARTLAGMKQPFPKRFQDSLSPD